MILGCICLPQRRFLICRREPVGKRRKGFALRSGAKVQRTGRAGASEPITDLHSAERCSQAANGRLKTRDTAQCGRDATKGARLCPQDQPQRAGTAQRVGVKQESLAVSTCCGWCFRLRGAPKRRYGATAPHTARCEKTSQLATISTDRDSCFSPHWQRNILCLVNIQLSRRCA